jgi:orotate phosphoribosyltransferase
MDKDVVAALSAVGAAKFGDFTYASGKRGPVYVDIRVLPSHPKEMDLICTKMSETVSGLDVDIVTGAETAGIPLSAVIANKLGKPMIYARKKPKNYGAQKKIEGLLKKGQKTVLIDDMITDGGSKLVFIEGIRESGGDVEDAVVVLDREQGGRKTLESVGVKLHSLTTLRELLKYLKQEGKITTEKHDEVLLYLQDPAEWEEAHARK